MKKFLLKSFAFVFLALLCFSLLVDTASALPIVLYKVKSWYWTNNTTINSCATGDVDGDGKMEIVTGGYCGDSGYSNAQLCVWDATTLSLKNVKTWIWTGSARINSVAIGDTDADGNVEIVTGGQTANSAQLCVWDGATLTYEGDRTWIWGYTTSINSVAIEDVDTDGKVEIMTGGYYANATPSFNGRSFSQLCVWNGATLSLENVKTWLTVGNTYIYSVATRDVNSDGKIEIVTGGNYFDGNRYVAQLCMWEGATLGLRNVKEWYWAASTYIYSVALGDVDKDGYSEIATGGCYYDGSRYVAQLCVWGGTTLELHNVQTWYWTGDTSIRSVGIVDLYSDGNNKIITGGYFNDGTRKEAQFCVWNGRTMTLENTQAWYWTSNTQIYAIACRDVIPFGEIVTGGSYNDGTRDIAQLCRWAPTQWVP